MINIANAITAFGIGLLILVIPTAPSEQSASKPEIVQAQIEDIHVTSIPCGTNKSFGVTSIDMELSMNGYGKLVNYSYKDYGILYAKPYKEGDTINVKVSYDDKNEMVIEDIEDRR